MKAKTYYLTQNLMYNCTHIFKHRWYHKVFGEPRLTIATCKAYSVKEAEEKFRARGFTVGLGF